MEKPKRWKVTDREPLLWPAECCKVEEVWPDRGAEVCVAAAAAATAAAAAASSSLPPKLVIKVIFSGPGDRDRDLDSELDSDSGLRKTRETEFKYRHRNNIIKTYSNWLTVYMDRMLGCLSSHSWNVIEQKNVEVEEKSQ